jgi:hypothetical protein
MAGWRPPRSYYTRVATNLIAGTPCPLDGLHIEVMPPD